MLQNKCQNIHLTPSPCISANVWVHWRDIKDVRSPPFQICTKEFLINCHEIPKTLSPSSLYFFKYWGFISLTRTEENSTDETFGASHQSNVMIRSKFLSLKQWDKNLLGTKSEHIHFSLHQNKNIPLESLHYAIIA